MATTTRKRPVRRAKKAAVAVSPAVSPVTPALSKVSEFRVKPWAVWPGVAVFAFGMMAGLIRGAESLELSVSDTTLLHREGVVAGATTEIGSGIVAIEVDETENPRGYAVTIEEPLSLYNLLLLATETTSLNPQFTQDKGKQLLTSVTGRASEWETLVNDVAVDSLDDVVVLPGMTVTLRDIGTGR